MLKLNIIAFLLVCGSFSLWLSYSTESGPELVYRPGEASSAEAKESTVEDSVDDEIRRFKKTFRRQRKEIERLNQDILRMDKKYMELWDRFEDQTTEVTALSFRLSRIEEALKEGTGFKKSDDKPSNLSPYALGETKPRGNNLGLLKPNESIPFHLILRVPSISDDQKAEYRKLILEHNKARTDIIRNRGSITNETLRKQLDDHRKSYESQFLDILKSSQKSEFEKVLTQYEEQRERNRKMQEERRQKRLEQQRNAKSGANQKRR